MTFSDEQELDTLLAAYRDAILVAGLARVLPTEIFDSERKEAAESAALVAVREHVRHVGRYFSAYQALFNADIELRYERDEWKGLAESRLRKWMADTTKASAERTECQSELAAAKADNERLKAVIKDVAHVYYAGTYDTPTCNFTGEDPERCTPENCIWLQVKG